MALNDGFQYLEQRDHNDNITKEGVASKKSPFCTADNSGIYDVVAENFRALKQTTDNFQLISAVAGSRSYTLTTNAVSGDKVTMGGVTLTAGTHFAVGATIVATANNMAAALNNNTTFNAIYTATVNSSGAITVTENTAGGGHTPAAATYTGTVVISSGAATISATAADQAEAIYNLAQQVQTLTNQTAASASTANTAAFDAGNSATAAQTAYTNAANVAKAYLQRNTVYSVGDIIFDADNLSKAYALLCSGSTTTGATTGTTGATAPATWAGLSGYTTDGTAVFTTIARRPTTRDQAGFTDIYTKNEVNELLNDIGLTVVDGELNITYAG